MLRRYHRFTALALFAMATGILIGLFGTTQTTKAADYINPNDKMTAITKQWLNSQALYRCWSLTDIDNRSKSDIESFKFFDATLPGSVDWDKVDVGYQSGKKSCSNGGDVRSLYQTINQDWAGDGKKAFCAVPATRSDGGESYNQCITGSADFDIEGGDPTEQGNSFKSAIDSLPKPQELSSYTHIGLSSDPMAYYLYRRTLEKQCGGGTNLLQGKVDLPAADSPTVVRASYVVGGTGEIQTFSYQLDKQQGETVDVHAQRGNPSSKRLKCEELSVATVNLAQSYASWAITYMNNQVADYLIAKAREVAPPRECNGPSALPEEDRCTNPMAQISAAIRACADGEAQGIRGSLDFIGRENAIKACATAKLPTELAQIITGITQGQVAENEASDGSAFEEDGGTSCSVDGLGWIICPVVTFLSEITDRAYDILADGLLAVQPSMFSQGGQTYEAWSAMRNIANVAFIVAFLFIIYSQITSAGISNYGMKKMLPRLIIAAILVNVSFWICAIAVDLSNILGYALKDLIGGEGGGSFEFHIRDGDSLDETGSGWTDLALVILAAGTIVYLGLSVLLPGLIIVLMALITVVAVLAVRQALIILLIVVAPLAFVAWLLPNTEDWFKKWFGLLKTLLLMFPIISLIFGASALASSVIMASTQNIVVQIVGALILVVPLFITPIVMKTAGGLLNRFGGVVNNADKGVFDRMKKSAGSYGDKRRNIRKADRLNGTSVIGRRADRLKGSDNRFARGAGKVLGKASWPGEIVAGGMAGRELTKERQAANAESAAKYAAENYIASRASNDDLKYASKIAGPTGDAVLANAYATQAIKEEKEKDVKAQQALLSDRSVDKLIEKLKDTSASAPERAAAARLIAEKGGHQHMQQAYDYLMKEGAANSEGIGDVQKLSAESFIRRKPAGVSATSANEMRNGSMKGSGYLDSLASRIEGGKFGAQEIASMDLDDHIRIGELAAGGKLSDSALQELSKQLNVIEQSDTMKLTPEQVRVLAAATSRQNPTRPDGSSYGLGSLN